MPPSTLLFPALPAIHQGTPDRANLCNKPPTRNLFKPPTRNLFKPPTRNLTNRLLRTFQIRLLISGFSLIHF
ncbi:hypothetical protein PMIN02_013019 [Paraphaeosphaeria minitans]